MIALELHGHFYFGAGTAVGQNVIVGVPLAGRRAGPGSGALERPQCLLPANP